MDYKKYKPLSQPAKCTDCKRKNILKAYRALCDPCALKKVEIRVPREQAISMGLIQGETESQQESEDTMAQDLKQPEVAQQVIVEEVNEEEETKQESESDEEGQAQAAAAAQA